MKIIFSTGEENSILTRLNKDHFQYIELTDSEKRFFNSLILRNRPLNCLEIGVGAGGSSILILNALTQFKGKLVSIDYSEYWHRYGVGEDYPSVKDKIGGELLKTGWLVDDYPELKEQWTLYTGGLTVQFMDQISRNGSIDLLFLDAAHQLPGELMDFLTVLPFLSENALIVIHDLHHYTREEVEKFSSNLGSHLCNTMLFSILRGEYYLNDIWENIENFTYRTPEHFHGIGACILTKKECLDNLIAFFNPLTYPWAHIPTTNEEQTILNWFAKYYDKFFTDYLKNIFRYQRNRILSMRNQEFAKKLKHIANALKNIGEDSLIEFMSTPQKKLLYGAGKQGLNCFHLFDKCNLNIDGMIYANPDIALSAAGLLGKTYPINNFCAPKEEYAVLISVNEKYNNEITNFLQKYNFNSIYTVKNWDKAMKTIKRSLNESD